MEADPTRMEALACRGCGARDRQIARLEARLAEQESREQARVAECETRIAGLETRIAELRAELARLRQLLEQSQRAARRQAAPFSKGPPKANPEKPGRKPGEDYGTKARRAVPGHIDEVHEAPLPDRCPHCGGMLVDESIDHQYQTEIPTTPIHRQFNIHVGRCAGCHKTVRGRHPLQTSNATGACASQLGPNAQAAIVQLSKDAGLSHGKIGRLFGDLFGIPLSRGGACQSMLRAAGRCDPHYHQILLSFPAAPWVVPDETGWRVGGLGAWLHTFVSDQAVAYLVAKERGIETSSRVIPEDYAGVLVHDGFASYNRYWQARHQTCLAHLLRRSREMLEVATRGAVIFPRKVQDLLLEALEIRDRRDEGLILPATARLHLRGGEFIADEVEDLMDQEDVVRSACEEVVAHTKSRSACLIFTAGIRHGEHVVRTLRERHGVECGFVTGDTPGLERERLLSAFRAGRLRYLANVNVLTTGFDAPNIDCVALVRPTNSAAALQGHAGAPRTGMLVQEDRRHRTLLWMGQRYRRRNVLTFRP